MLQIINAAVAAFGCIQLKLYLDQNRTLELLHTKQILNNSAIENCGTYTDCTIVFKAKSMQSSTK